MEGNNYYYCDNSSSNLLLSNNISEDCLIHILLWLPVISLLRFKSVCKSWRDIIQNPFFIHTHHANKQQQQVVAGSSSSTPVFLRYSPWICRGDIFSVSGPEFEVYQDLGIPGPEELDSGPYSSTHYSMVICCNGIICLHAGCGPDCFQFDHKPSPKCFDISLWNPAIKQQYRFLPPIPPFALLEEKNHDGENLNYFIDLGGDFSAHSVEHFVGFGFDLKTKDYKVLLITYDIYGGRHYFYARGVQLYSLSTNSWKCIDASHALPNLTINSINDWRQGHYYLNGSYLFMGGYLDEGAPNSTEEGNRQECFNPVLMSFDFTKEIFRTIQLPFDFKLETDKYLKFADIILFGEKIAVTNTCQVRSEATAGLDIWVLNHEINGGSESWSKFYTFVSDARPKFITDNGEFIILLDDSKSVPKLQLLNLVTEEIKDLKYDCAGPSDGYVFPFLIRQVGVYKPSLLSIVGNGASNR